MILCLLLGELNFGIRFAGDVGGVEGTASNGDECVGGGGGDNGGSESGDKDEMVDRGRDDNRGDDVDGPAAATGLLFKELLRRCEVGLLLGGLLRGDERASLFAEGAWLRRDPSEKISLVRRAPEDDLAQLDVGRLSLYASCAESSEITEMRVSAAMFRCLPGVHIASYVAS